MSLKNWRDNELNRLLMGKWGFGNTTKILNEALEDKDIDWDDPGPGRAPPAGTLEDDPVETRREPEPEPSTTTTLLRRTFAKIARDRADADETLSPATERAQALINKFRGPTPGDDDDEIEVEGRPGRNLEEQAGPPVYRKEDDDDKGDDNACDDDDDKESFKEALLHTLDKTAMRSLYENGLTIEQATALTKRVLRLVKEEGVPFREGHLSPEEEFDIAQQEWDVIEAGTLEPLAENYSPVEKLLKRVLISLAERK